MSSNSKYTRSTVDVTAYHTNLNQEIIQITEDKLRLLLHEHIKYMEHRNQWIAPLSLIITLAIVFTTTTFQDAVYLSADTWRAIFIITSVITVGWLIQSFYILFKAKTITDLINKIKNNVNEEHI